MAGVEARPLELENRDAALAFLARDSMTNLFLLDLTARLGLPPAPGEAPSEIIAAWREGDVAGVLALRPTIVVSAASAEVIDAFVPYVEPIGVGLVKSSVEVVDALWERMGRGRRRHVLLDRLETAYAVHEGEARLVAVRPHERVRAAALEDLEFLIVAARESLREEGRPDPFAGDVRGFKRWVRGRVSRARVVESGGRVVCVGYADVRRRNGWLLQGVYCWPRMRRRRFASTGVSDLCREAFAARADHVQLAVVDHNQAGRRLYENLGFKPYGKLRTILFS